MPCSRLCPGELSGFNRLDRAAHHSIPMQTPSCITGVANRISSNRIVANATTALGTEIAPTPTRRRSRSRKFHRRGLARWTPRGMKTDSPMNAPQTADSRHPHSPLESQITAAMFPKYPPTKTPIAPPTMPARTKRKRSTSPSVLLVAGRQLRQYLHGERRVVSCAGRVGLLDHDASGEPSVPVVALDGCVDPLVRQ